MLYKSATQLQLKLHSIAGNQKKLMHQHMGLFDNAHHKHTLHIANIFTLA